MERPQRSLFERLTKPRMRIVHWKPILGMSLRIIMGKAVPPMEEPQATFEKKVRHDRSGGATSRLTTP